MPHSVLRFSPGKILWRARCRIGLFGLGLVGVVSLGAAEKDDFGWMDLEQLGKIKVVTSAKRPEPAWTSGSALTVVTPEEISFDGADSLPAALRLVPGLNVAQIDSHNWAVSARGFNAQYSNKLLVMVDGRSIYTPLFGGVLWDAPDTPLENLARIEVVRGPGGSLWGANAVNGVINFVTAPAADTPGTLVVADAGTTMRRGLLREGFSLSGNWAGRVHVQATEREPTLTARGMEANDRWRKESAGFRVDRAAPDGLQLTFSGEAYAGHGGQTQPMADVVSPTGAVIDSVTGADTHGGHLLARAERREADGTATSGQIFFDATRTRVPFLGERRQTFDGEFQRDQPWGEHVLSLGVGYRQGRSHTIATKTAFFSPADETERVANAFLQAQFSLVPGQVDLVAGAKVEHSDIASAQVQPSVRAVWRVRDGHAVWASLSRAVRNPSFLERAVRFDATVLPQGAIGAGSPATLVRWSGSGRLSPETVVVAEAGWRARAGERVSFDASVYVNRYRRLVDIVPGTFSLPLSRSGTAYRVWQWDYVNSLDGLGYGGEFAATWHLAPRSQLSAGSTLARVEQSGPAGGLNESYFETSTPRRSYFVRAGYGFAVNWALHLEWRAVGDVAAVGVGSYGALDARIAWRATPEWDIVLAGENLTDPSHPEFRNGGNLVTTELRRGVSLKLTWRK
jgi:iron complex outermembrane receptor protein